MRKAYSIRLFNYDPTSGGIKVMYALYGALLMKGEHIIPNAVYEDASNIVGIYPEISHGNELQAGTVVRYILNKKGVMALNGVAGPEKFDDTDIQFVFSKMFAPETPEDRLMFIPAINTSVFYNKKKSRTKSAVFQGKGVAGNLHPEDSIFIDRRVAQDQEALADILNECEVLYSYDPVSAMTEIARLCGCRVVYLSDAYSEKDYELYEPGKNGMSFDMNTNVPLDSDAFMEHYKGLQKKFFDEQLPNFIDVTQK